MREVAPVGAVQLRRLHLGLAELEPRVPGRALLLVTEREVDERAERVVLRVGGLELRAGLSEATLLEQLLPFAEEPLRVLLALLCCCAARGEKDRERERDLVARPRVPARAVRFTSTDVRAEGREEARVYRER